MLQLSSIMSAVKPKDRTDQYKILAAMYSLNAHLAPVTAKQIRDTLALQLGKNEVPKNVPDRLRKYKAFVDPAGKGPPLLWALTPKGLERLRSLSGLTLAAPATASDFGIDVGFVCALEDPEMAALVNACGGASEWAEVGDAKFPHVYRQAELSVGKRKLKVVGTTATSMGLTAAAIATTHLVLQFRPRLVIMVGVAAGTRGGDKRFGDVLVADPSVDYNSGKVVQSNGIRDFLPDPYPIGLNPRLRSVLQKYRSFHPIFEQIRARWAGNQPPGRNRLHMGPLGAADQVIDDPSRVLEIQQNWRKLIGVEMETYAVYRACTESPEPRPRFVSFKSVCDFAAQKADSWQEYAAFVAAEFAVSFLRNEWETLWPI